MDFIHFLNGFRKFTFAFIVLVSGIALLLSGFLTGKEFVGLVAPMSVAFMGANGIEHMTKAAIIWIQSKSKSS